MHLSRRRAVILAVCVALAAAALASAALAGAFDNDSEPQGAGPNERFIPDVARDSTGTTGGATPTLPPSPSAAPPASEAPAATATPDVTATLPPAETPAGGAATVRHAGSYVDTSDPE